MAEAKKTSVIVPTITPFSNNGAEIDEFLPGSAVDNWRSCVEKPRSRISWSRGSIAAVDRKDTPPFRRSSSAMIDVYSSGGQKAR